MSELERIDAEIAAIEQHVCVPGEFAGALMGWCDYMIERELVEAEDRE